jgi:hypothetical protein
MRALDGLPGTHNHGYLWQGFSLFGREREVQALGDLIDHIGERGGALVVRGEAGIGKSALLSTACMRARDRGMLVLAAAGVQSEAHLPFAGLHHPNVDLTAAEGVVSGDRPAPSHLRAASAGHGVPAAFRPAV